MKSTWESIGIWVMVICLAVGALGVVLSIASGSMQEQFEKRDACHAQGGIIVRSGHCVPEIELPSK